MKRRAFLLSASATTASFSLPGMIASAFAQDVDDGRDRVAELAALSDAYRRAQRAGRPLLVLVVPADGGARYQRGHALGELLNHGGDAAFADLALAEVVCAGMDTLRRLVPQAGEGEPWMVVVETDRHPAEARALRTELPEWPDHWTFQGAPEDLDRTMNDAIDQRIALLSALVHDALARDPAMIAARAEVAARQLDPSVVRDVRRAIARGAVTPEQAAAAPALVRAAATDGSARAASLRASLAAAARARLQQNPVPGSAWARSWGCGVEVEGRVDNVAVGCGMGHVPARSQRFLYWLTR